MKQKGRGQKALDSCQENSYLLEAACPSSKTRNDFSGGRKPISPPLNHITAADTRFGLGQSRPEMIEVVKLGWDEGTLI